MKPGFDNIDSVLFVCLGNICRSPLAEGIFRAELRLSDMQERITVDSAGTGAWHVNDAPDPRSMATASHHGLDISSQRSRQVTPADYDSYDLIVAMDRSNMATLKARAPSTAHGKIVLFMELTQGQAVDVPDPYYDHADGFENVYRMLREGCAALVNELSGRDCAPSENPSSTT